MNTAKIGRIGDRKTIKFLTDLGLTSFTISAASAGVFDTISWNEFNVVFVQNKRNRMPPRNELLQLMHCKTPPNTYRFIFLWKTRARKPEVWQVFNTEIVQIDHDDLIALLIFQK